MNPLHGRKIEPKFAVRLADGYLLVLFAAACMPQPSVRGLLSTRQSSWIVIQPLMPFASRLADNTGSNMSHPMGLHLQYLAVGVANWREYLNYIAERLKTFVSGTWLHLTSLDMPASRSIPWWEVF